MKIIGKGPSTTKGGKEIRTRKQSLQERLEEGPTRSLVDGEEKSQQCSTRLRNSHCPRKKGFQIQERKEDKGGFGKRRARPVNAFAKKIRKRKGGRGGRTPSEKKKKKMSIGRLKS